MPGPAWRTKPRTSGSTLLGSPHLVPPPGEPLLRWWKTQRFDQEAAGSHTGCGGFHRKTARFCWRRWSASPTCRQWRWRWREGHLARWRRRFDGNAWERGGPSRNLCNKKMWLSLSHNLIFISNYTLTFSLWTISMFFIRNHDTG